MIPLRKFKNLCNHIRISTSSSIFTKNNPSTPIERVRRISYSYIPLLRLLKNESRPFQTCPREISPVACLVRRGGNRMKNEKRMKMDIEKQQKETWNAKWNFESCSDRVNRDKPMKYESEYISTPTHDANQESPRIKNQERLKSTIIHYPLFFLSYFLCFDVNRFLFYHFVKLINYKNQ